MHWFLLTLISPFTHAIVNFLDKYLITRYAGEEHSASVGSLVLFSSLFSIIILPIFLLAGIPGAVPSATEVVVLLVTGIVYLGAIILYLYALFEDEVSNVVPFWLTAPIFDFILAAIFLGEQLTGRQIIASLLILAGGVVLTLQQDETDAFRVRLKPALLMVGSAVLFAVNDLLFKKIALSGGFWDSLFFTYLGYLLFGAVLFAFITSYRASFLSLVKTAGRKILSINGVNETLMLVGDAAVRFATLLAPLALVETVADSFQPLLVFVLGIVLTLFWPHLGAESLARRDLRRKVVAIVIMIAGTLLLGLFS